METHAHARLKVLAFEFLMAQGCAAVAAEVACPISRYRIDVAGYLDKLPARARVAVATVEPVVLARGKRAATVLIECKASRSDFLRDHRQTPALLQRREHLEGCLDRYREEVVKPMEPHLRRSDGFLFAEMEEWDYTRSRSHGHRALLRALRRVDAQLYSETKFFMIDRYCLGGRLFILAPRGMIGAKELPRGWGLLEADTRWAEIRLAVEPPVREPKEQHVMRTLRNIAAAATRDARWGMGSTRHAPSGLADSATSSAGSGGGVVVRSTVPGPRAGSRGVAATRE